MNNNLKKNKKIIIVCLLLIVVVFLIFLINLLKQKVIISDESENYSYLKKYDCNQFIPVYVTEEDMVKKYLNEYKNNMLFDLDEAWNNLNKEYRELKFGTKERYIDYVESFLSISTLSMEVDKYSVSNVYGKKVFNVYDKSGNQYIIKENSIMNYEIYLDNETVKIK